jgi:alkaline phosphatase D
MAQRHAHINAGRHHMPHLTFMLPLMNKRHFIQALSSSILLSSCGTLAAQSLRHNPFLLGVASGSPSLDGFVLWTRLLGSPAGEPLPDSPIELGWELASDPNFRVVVQTGRVLAVPEEGHSVHVEVGGLNADTRTGQVQHYWYRFMVGTSVSPIGRSRTLPPSNSQQPLKLALASCQNYEHGYFNAYQHMANESLDCVLFVGDYIYEYGSTPGRTRQHNGPTCYSLEDYRARYALYKSDPDLQRAHAAFPWIVTWDDHELANDYSKDRSATENGQDFDARRNAAYRAYWEHQPLRRAQKPTAGRMPLYRHYRWGNIANLHVLDTRQYRDLQICTPEDQGGSRSITDANCPQRLHSGRSLLGDAQEAWLQRNIQRSDASFDIIGQQSIMAQMRMPASRSAQPQEADTFWNDSWDGYPQARARAISQWGQKKNVITLGGDVHATYLSHLKADFDDPASSTLASEIIGTSISSPSWSQATTERVMGYNPHIKFGKSDQRGYTVVEVGSQQTLVTLRVIDNARIPQSRVETASAFVIERKQPGIQAA